jgi:protoheme IX farnesyltransferase
LVSALAGYAVSFHILQAFELWQPILLVVGLYLVAAGSFALNQAQEWRIDSRMERTKHRPIPRGVLKVWQGYFLGAIMVISGVGTLALLGPLPAELAVLTVVLYNGVYTLFWKKSCVFGAVPGAIPGAMPVVIGFSVNSTQIWRPECVYLFLVMYLWQMPHFWSLAIRYKDDYALGGFPVLPVSLGSQRALYHVGLYVFTYVGVALMAPWFLHANLLYFLLVLPISLKVLIEFRRYLHAPERKAWLPFFLWTNFSLLIYLAVPVMDKWLSWAWQSYV